MKSPPSIDSPWIHFLPVRVGTRTVYLSPYQVVKVLVGDHGMDQQEKAMVEVHMSNGERHVLLGNEAWNAAKVFSSLGVVASIAEDARESRDQ